MTKRRHPSFIGFNYLLFRLMKEIEIHRYIYSTVYIHTRSRLQVARHHEVHFKIQWLCCQSGGSIFSIKVFTSYVESGMYKD